MSKHCCKKEMDPEPAEMCCVPACPSGAQPEVLAQLLTQDIKERIMKESSEDFWVSQWKMLLLSTCSIS